MQKRDSLEADLISHTLSMPPVFFVFFLSIITPEAFGKFPGSSIDGKPTEVNLNN